MKLGSDDCDVREGDVTRLSPFARHRINVLGRCSFSHPGLRGGLRSLGDGDVAGGGDGG
ncbi:hypothetical protein QNN03_36220 [Streptomyces sp. GXMU-J15]|uniref:Uncharacterized protein n=1 Tax=Streptomyces fuscus TaxID=3048495 RepID=A0ABT7JDL0_9ACTN|nr:MULTISPECIES: hypothetical protein [Streptomyces]MDL2081887.1 hypothetical protein [Streptomyces fuscus]